MRVLTAGHACVDITPKLETSPGIEPGVLYAVGPLRFALGGSAINTARKLHELGTEVSMSIAQGNDTLGIIYERLLGELGIDRHLVRTDLATSYSVVVEHGHHDRTFWQHEGFNAAFDPGTIDLDATAPDIFHWGYPSLVPFVCLHADSLAATFRRAKAKSISTSLDLAHVSKGSVASTVDWSDWFTHTLPSVDVLTPSWDDVCSALGLGTTPSRESMREVADQLLSWGCAIVQLSAGKEGFLLKTADAQRFATSGAACSSLPDSWHSRELWFDAEMIDAPTTTVGAGDSLTAGLLHAIGLGLDPQGSGEFARDVAGRHLRGEPTPR